MASLDVLDYLTSLDEALAKPGADGAPLLAPQLRRQALRDARRVIDAMAFKFAILDERPLPEDLDYLRAIEAVKPAARAAEVLAKRRPHYARVRRRRLVTTWSVLAVIAGLIGGLAYVATSEKADELALIQENPAVDVTYSTNRTFEVLPHMDRLYVTADIFVAKNSQGSVEVRLLDPDGKVVLFRSFSPLGNNYLRHNVELPKSGEWMVLVDYNDAHGPVRLTVSGISPTR